MLPLPLGSFKPFWNTKIWLLPAVPNVTPDAIETLLPLKHVTLAVLPFMVAATEGSDPTLLVVTEVTEVVFPALQVGYARPAKGSSTCWAPVLALLCAPLQGGAGFCAPAMLMEEPRLWRCPWCKAQ